MASGSITCGFQLFSVVEEIQLTLDQLLIDFHKAFAIDTVPYQRLLKKLYHYGIQGNVYNWIHSWLTKRTQWVVIKGHSSTYIHVESDASQGTVLSPLVFLLYINDMICPLYIQPFNYSDSLDSSE